MGDRNEAALPDLAETRPDLAETLLLHLESEEAFGIDRLPAPGPGREEPSPEERLKALEKQVRGCTACALWKHRQNIVFGEGNPRADLLFVGEAPGRDEDLVGIPFVGRAGRLLDRMIQAMGLSRNEVFIANVLKCRPPNNRSPSIEEIASCRGYLEEQIGIISPRVIVALGAPAARTLLDRKEGIGALRGKTYPYKGDTGMRVVPTFHPAYLLRNESEKGKAWEDLKIAMKILNRA